MSYINTPDIVDLQKNSVTISGNVGTINQFIAQLTKINTYGDSVSGQIQNIFATSGNAINNIYNNIIAKNTTRNLTAQIDCYIDQTAGATNAHPLVAMWAGTNAGSPLSGIEIASITQRPTMLGNIGTLSVQPGSLMVRNDFVSSVSQGDFRTDFSVNNIGQNNVHFIAGFTEFTITIGPGGQGTVTVPFGFTFNNSVPAIGFGTAFSTIGNISAITIEVSGQGGTSFQLTIYNASPGLTINGVNVTWIAFGAV